MCSRPAKAIRSANSSKGRFAHIGGPSSGAATASRRKASIKSTGEVLVEVDPRYFRPTEVDALLGDPSKATRQARLATQDELRQAGDRRWCRRT